MIVPLAMLQHNGKLGHVQKGAKTLDGFALSQPILVRTGLSGTALVPM